MTIPRIADVLVIGAGVIGCAVARTLAARGRRVLVVDRGAIGGEASSAAAGVLGVASGGDEGERLALRRASRRLFPALAAALREETGIETGFARTGVTALAFDDDEVARLTALCDRRRAAGLDAGTIDARMLRDAEPAASGDALGGAVFPDDATIVAEWFVAALAASARRRGATLVPGAPVHAVECSGDRVERVRIGDAWTAPGTVVLAAGAWSSSVADLATELGVAPVRGQMLAMRAARAPRGVLTAGDAFLVPRPDGETWAGATFEAEGFAKAVTPEGLARLAAHAARLAPELARTATVVRAWAGLRPSCSGGGPVVGRSRRIANLVVASGHYRSGILLAPITAEAVRAYVDAAPPPPEILPFDCADPRLRPGSIL